MRTGWCRHQLGKLLEFSRSRISLPYTIVVWCISAALCCYLHSKNGCVSQVTQTSKFTALAPVLQAKIGTTLLCLEICAFHMLPI